MSRFIYRLEFTVIPSLAPQFEKNFGKIIQAHMEHPRGLGKYMTFTKSFAGSDYKIALSVPMDSLGFMDKWMHTPEVVMEHFGKEEGIEILQLYCDATKGWMSSIEESYDALSYA